MFYFPNDLQSHFLYFLYFMSTFIVIKILSFYKLILFDTSITLSMNNYCDISEFSFKFFTEKKNSFKQKGLMLAFPSLLRVKSNYPKLLMYCFFSSPLPFLRIYEILEKTQYAVTTSNTMEYLPHRHH